MATQPDDQETPEIEEEPVEPNEEAPEAEQPEAEDEEEVIISFDGEAEEEAAPENSSIRQMRQALREKDKRISELERTHAAPKIERRAKPTLDDHGYDEEAYDADLLAWNAEQAQAKDAETKAQEETRKAEESWNRDLDAYRTRKATIGIPDFDDAEDAVKTSLSTVQQAVIVRAASDPAALIYAVGKNPAKLAELKQYDDPIKLAAAIVRMEGSVKITRRKRAPELDRPLKGSASTVPVTADEQLEKLEKEADRTGDRTKFQQYKRKLKAREQ